MGELLKRTATAFVLLLILALVASSGSLMLYDLALWTGLSIAFSEWLWMSPLGWRGGILAVLTLAILWSISGFYPDILTILLGTWVLTTVMAWCFRSRWSWLMGHSVWVYWITVQLFAPFVLAWMIWRVNSDLWCIAATLAITIGTDAGAYFAGKMLGKHRAWPAVSPKKTWEGVLGGLLVGTHLGFMVFHLPWIGAALLSILAVFGDFWESACKRAWNAKDSGWLLPGHGGFLDRMDSLLVVFPFSVLFFLK